MPKTSLYTVFVRSLEVYAYHGVPAEERVLGHRYVIDVEMEVEGRADSTDKVSDSVNYSSAAQMIESVVRDEQCHTIERLAAMIADSLMDEFGMITEVSVSVEKPLPPMPLIAEAAGVRIVKQR
jgi:dihydroneopterin aldolase